MEHAEIQIVGLKCRYYSILNSLEEGKLTAANTLDSIFTLPYHPDEMPQTSISILAW